MILSFIIYIFAVGYEGYPIVIVTRLSLTAKINKKMKSIIQMVSVSVLISSLMFVYLLDKSIYCMIVLFTVPIVLGKFLSVIYKRELHFCKSFIKDCTKELMKTVVAKIRVFVGTFSTPVKA